MTPEETKNREKALALIALTSAMVLWGLSYVITKYALAEIDPMALLGLRILLSTTCYVAIQLISRSSLKGCWKYWKRILPLSVGGVITSQLGFIMGLKYTSPAHGALIYTLLPIFAAMLSFFFFKERLTKLTKCFSLPTARTSAFS